MAKYRDFFLQHFLTLEIETREMKLLKQKHTTSHHGKVWLIAKGSLTRVAPLFVSEEEVYIT